ncbi:MAG: hypothetical protein CMJ19_16820 [Phycisphaeraceae bacterium]|nr:hypothetical protein [Phycisphaeraceae bacterium]
MVHEPCLSVLRFGLQRLGNFYGVWTSSFSELMLIHIVCFTDLFQVRTINTRGWKHQPVW